MSESLIRCQQLKKNYGKHNVLESVNFEIQPGQLVGFLGPNGAGKTTTIRILLGLLQATSGESTVFGKPCWTRGKEIRKDIGYLPGDVHMYRNMTGVSLLTFFANARRIDCGDEIKRLANSFQLDISKTIRKYSTGMRQKLGLIQALMHKPRLVILDEPTSALDPLIRKTVFAELKNVVNEGKTVVFSSHSLSEVEELCDEVIILRSGKIVEQKSIVSLRDRAIRKVTIKFTMESSIPEKLPDRFSTLQRDERTVVGTWAGNATELIKWLESLSIKDVIIEKPDLNDLFLTYYEQEEVQ